VLLCFSVFSIVSYAQQTPPPSPIHVAKEASTSAVMPSPIPPPGSSLVTEAIDKVAPLSPPEILEFRRTLEQRKEAFSQNATGRAPARQTTSIYNLDISPGAIPPVVRIESGQGGIVSFVDAAGRPWPIKLHDNFNKAALAVSFFADHQLSVSTTSQMPIAVGVAVSLEGLPSAVTLTVLSGQAAVDYQVHMVVPQYRGGPPGPVAYRGEPSLTAGDLMSYLLLTPPASARKLIVEGLPGAYCWQVSKDRMVFRTNALVTTGAFRTQGIGDGTAVYELPLSPVVRVVSGERYLSARITGIVAGGI
jgi:intracellular multiplication protein IcmK